MISFLQKEFGINYVRFLNYLVLFLIIVCLDALFQAIFSFNIFGFKNISSYGMSRISGFFHNEYILGSFLFSFSWTIFIFFLNKKKTDSIINIFILSIFICTIFFAGEKAATFKLLLLLCLTFIFLKTYRVLFIKSFVPTFIFIFLILILQNNFFLKNHKKENICNNEVTLTNILDRYYFIPILKDALYQFHPEFIYDRLCKKDKNISKEINDDLNLQEETNHENKDKIPSLIPPLSTPPSLIVSPLANQTVLARTAYLIFKDNIFFGSGIKTFRKLCLNSKYNNGKKFTSITHCNNHPHNIYLEILSEIGLVGLFLILIFFFTFFYENRNFVNNDKKRLFLIYFFCIFFPFQTTGSFFNNYVLLTLFFSLSNYYFSSKIN